MSAEKDCRGHHVLSISVKNKGLRESLQNAVLKTKPIDVPKKLQIEGAIKVLSRRHDFWFCINYII